MPTGPEGKASNRRLDSWKEIAAFFGRDERTVKRWEKERALPVHRLPGGSRARVFAFTEELDRWMHSLESLPEAAPAADEPPEAAVPEPPDSPAASAGPPFLRRSTDFLKPIPWYRRRLVFVGCAALIGFALLAVLSYRHHGVTLSASTRPANQQAEELYLRGRYYWNRRTPEDLNKAVDLFTQAIVHDPNYAPAYVGLADCYNLLREFAAMPAEEAFPRAMAAAQKAVELDDASAEAHASLGFVTFYWKWDPAGAEQEFRRAIELNPSYGTAHHWWANVLSLLDRPAEALQEIKRAEQLDPGSPAILADKALILFHSGHVEDAIALLKQIDASQPAFFSTHKYLSHIYLSQGDYPDYLAEAEKAATLSHDEQELTIVRAAQQGFKDGGAQGMLNNILRTQQKFYDAGQLSPFLLAITHARLGHKQEALRYLQTAYQQHDPYFTGIASNSGLVSLHDDPSFRKLVTEAGLPPLS